VQIHVRAPFQMTKFECRMTIGPVSGVKCFVRHSDFVIRHFLKPPCLSSYRASFVNSYSSVQVRPGAPSFALSRRKSGQSEGCPP
jgi:hypothetical protein